MGSRSEASWACVRVCVCVCDTCIEWVISMSYVQPGDILTTTFTYMHRQDSLYPPVYHLIPPFPLFWHAPIDTERVCMFTAFSFSFSFSFSRSLLAVLPCSPQDPEREYTTHQNKHKKHAACKRLLIQLLLLHAQHTHIQRSAGKKRK